MLTTIDFYKFDKGMATRVSEFMNATIWGDVVRSQARAEIKRCNANIDAYTKQIIDQPNGSTRIEELKNKLISAKSELETAQNELSEKLAEKAKFEYTSYDKAFYKAYEKATNENELSNAILDWIESIGGLRIEISDTIILDKTNYGFVGLFRKAIGGESKGTTRTRIQSGGTVFNNAKRKKTEVLYLMYGKLAELMLIKGTLKPTEIPESVREMYAPKKATKKVAKSEVTKEEILANPENLTDLEIVESAITANDEVRYEIYAKYNNETLCFFVDMSKEDAFAKYEDLITKGAKIK